LARVLRVWGLDRFFVRDRNAGLAGWLPWLTVVGERFERYGWMECVGVLRCAQDDSKNRQRQTETTAKQTTANADNGNNETDNGNSRQRRKRNDNSNSEKDNGDGETENGERLR
jgi:hypothetical protein